MTERKRNGTIFRLFPLTVICAVLLLLTAPVTVRADTVREIGILVEFGQSEARSMLGMVNAFRKGDDAWAWNSSNTEKERYNGLRDLSYDYNLELVAMIRAAEIAVSFSHTRPNGQDCFTAGGWGSGYNVYGSTAGENIAAGYGSAASAFVGWQETDYYYSGQGHRRNMLSSGYTAIGIGHVQVNGVDYWVQEFGNRGGSSASEALDGYYGVDVEILSSLFSGYEFRMSDGSTGTEVTYGQTGQLPDAGVYIVLSSEKRLPAAAELVWKNEDDSVASFDESGAITAHRVGQTTISTSYEGQSFSYVIKVKPADIGNYSVTAADQIYDGTAWTPQVTVSNGADVLVRGTDYTLRYTDNTNAGQARITVTGMGNYTGTALGTFTIHPKDLMGGSISGLSDVVYTGEALTQPVTVMLEGKTLREKTDYTLSWSDNTDAGPAGVQVIGKGNYTGRLTGSFTISPADIAGASVTAPDQTYTGYGILPVMNVVWNGRKLTEGRDFTVEYSSNVEVGTAHVTVTGIGNLYGTAEGSFRIIRHIPMSLEKGSRFTIGGMVYQVTKAGESQKATVRFMKTTGAVSTLKIPSTVTRNGIVYKVTSIYKNALKGHSELRTLSVGNYVTTIGAGSFYRCTGLTSVTLGTRVSSVGKQAFYGCAALKKITVKSAKLSGAKMGARAFKGIYAKATFRVPYSLIGTYDTIFRNAGAGEKVRVTGI